MSTVVGSPPGVIASGYNPAPPTIPPTGLVLWLDANDLSQFTLTGTHIEQWRDKSASARVFVPETATKGAWRDRTQNSKPVVRFAGTVGEGGLLRTANWAAPTNDFSRFAVAYTDTTVITNKRVYMADPAIALSHNNANTAYGGLIASPAAWVNAGSAVVNQWNLQSCIRTAGSMQFRSNAVNVGSPLSTTMTGATAIHRLGGDSWSSTGLVSCMIAESIIYNRVLTTGERDQVESYLRTKWGTP